MLKNVENDVEQEMDGRPMTVNKASATRVARIDEEPSPRQSLSSFKIYVANIPWKADNSSLKQLFSKYGEVINAKVVKYHGVRVFGFVTMVTREASEHAIWYLNNQVSTQCTFWFVSLSLPLLTR
jgi:RNA recognition motif-containing protein